MGNEKTEKVNPFEAKTSEKLDKISEEFDKKVNSSDQGTKVYSALLNDQVEQKEKWMVDVAKKASMRHEELKKECEEAGKIKPDIKRFNEQGVAETSYSEEVWKKKNAPFKKLKDLAEQLDSALTNGTVQEFEKLEKLIK